MTQAILTEQERNDIEDKVEMVIGKVAFDAIEEAIIAKLGSAPKPVTQAWIWRFPEGEYHDLPFPTVEDAEYELAGYDGKAIPLCLLSDAEQAYLQGAAAQLSAEPMFWYRPRSDGLGYAGPIHNDDIEPVRKSSGGWMPLHTLKGQQ